MIKAYTQYKKRQREKAPGRHHSAFSRVWLPKSVVVQNRISASPVTPTARAIHGPAAHNFSHGLNAAILRNTSAKGGILYCLRTSSYLDMSISMPSVRSRHYAVPMTRLQHMYMFFQCGFKITRLKCRQHEAISAVHSYSKNGYKRRSCEECSTSHTRRIYPQGNGGRLCVFAAWTASPQQHCRHHPRGNE